MPAMNDYGKLVLLLVIFLGATVLRALELIPEQLWQGIATTELGYIIGNGANAVRKQPPSPVLVPRYPAAPDEAE